MVMRSMKHAAVAVTGWCWVALGPLAPLTARAEDHAAPSHGAEAAPAPPRRTDILDLGKFRIRGSRPMDDEVTDVQLGVFLVLSSKATERDYHAIEGWKH